MVSIFEQIVRDSVDGVIAFDRECRYTVWNPAMERISGVTAAEAIGRVAFDLFPFLVETGEERFFRFALAGESAVSTDRPFVVPATGRAGFFEGHYAPLRDEDGAVTGGLAIIRDVTERRRAGEERARRIAERVTRQSEERYQSFVAQSTEGIWRVELERPVDVSAPVDAQIDAFYESGYLAECNDAMARMYGFERADEIVGARLGDLLPQTDEHNVAYLRAFVESSYRLEGAESHEVDRSGAPKHFRNNLVGVVESGRLVRAWGIQQDITDRVQTERAIARNASWLRLAQVAARVCAFEVDVATGGAVWSEGFRALLGLGDDAVEPDLDAFLALVHPDDRARALDAIRRAFAAWEPYADEFRVLARDGRALWLAARGRVERDEDGTRMIGVIFDITDQKRIEAELERAIASHRGVEERLSRLVEASGRLLNLRGLDEVQAAVVDLSRRLVTADGYAIWRRAAEGNDLVWRAVASWGVSREYLDGSMRLLDSRTPVLDRPIVADDVFESDALATRHALYRSEGIHSLLVLPMRIRGEIGGTMAFYYREPQRFVGADTRVAEAIANLASAAIEGVELFEEQSRLRAEAEEANRLKDEFLATVSHELRTPLTAIVGWSRLLLDGRLDEAAARRAVETIDRNARAQAQIVEDILDVSRIVTGRLHLDVEPIGLASVVDAAVDVVRPAAAAKGVRVRAEIDPAAGHVAGDAHRLQQVVWNLLSNAVKFTPEGGLVEAIVERSPTGARLAVRDTGAGIPAEFLPYVFDPFRQADSSTTRRVGGLGLGLAIVRHLVELHGGRVRAESEGPGRGATFTVELPTPFGDGTSPGGRRSRAGAANDPRDAARGEAPFLAGVRVLVVDDDPDTRAMLEVAFTCSGATVETAASTDEALAAIERVSPHLIVADIAMPGRDGYDLIRSVRANGPERVAATPAIALTAYARAEDRRRALEAGFQSHVAKPVEPWTIVAIAADLLEVME